MNIGFCMSGTGSCVMAGGAPGILPTWVGNTTTGAADPNFYFASAGGSGNAILQVEVAGYAPYNTFGWFATDASGNILAGSFVQLFNGAASQGAVAAFTPTASYGFYLTSPAGTFYTLSSLSPTDPRNQHFAVFVPNGNNNNDVFWIAAEDLELCNSDKDYNDLVVKVTVSPIPEPGTLLLFGSGLLGIAGALRRRLIA